jgi:Zn-finger nucleic acid-binding protein
MAQCPRCFVALRAAHRAFADGRSAPIALCGLCGGVWMEASPLEAGLPALVEAVRSASATNEPGFLACPVDSSLMKSVRVETITLDTCPRCSGLWIDRDEREAVDEVHRSIERTSPADAPAEGYRVAGGARRADAGAARCFRCDAEFVRSELVPTNSGLGCRPCVRTMTKQVEPSRERLSRLDRVLRFIGSNLGRG